MSALLKAIGVYLAVVVPLVAWMVAVGYAQAPDFDEGWRVVIYLAPFILVAVGVIALLAFTLLIYVPIASLMDHYKEKEGRK